MPDPARVIALRPVSAAVPGPAVSAQPGTRARTTTPARAGTPSPPPASAPPARVPPAREPLWRHIVGDVLRRERRAQHRTLKDVADAARISMPYLSEIERGRKEASSEVLAAAAHALGLGLADLLTLARDELARSAGVRLAGAAAPAAPGPELAPGSAGASGAGGRAGSPAGGLGTRCPGPRATVRSAMSLAA